MTVMPVIQCEGVSKLYGNNLKAVNNVTLSLSVNQFYAIRGRSGAGKTTLLQVLGLLDDATSGKLYIDGKDMSLANEAAKADIRLRKIGFVFQSYYLNEKMKAYENVMLPMFLNRDIKDRAARAKELLDRVGLKDRVNHFPRQLSGGEQQRVAIARALANDPACIFADEPTGNLDTENEMMVFNILKQLSQQEKCVLVISHNPNVLQFADKKYSMLDGVLSHEE